MSNDDICVTIRSQRYFEIPIQSLNSNDLDLSKTYVSVDDAQFNQNNFHQAFLCYQYALNIYLICKSSNFSNVTHLFNSKLCVNEGLFTSWTNKYRFSTDKIDSFFTFLIA